MSHSDKISDEDHIEDLRAALAASERIRLQLAEALKAYADPRHWGISRDDLNYRVISWIGPGATKRGVPDAMEIARAALAAHDALDEGEA